MKRLLLAIGIFFLVNIGLVNAQIFAPEGLNMPGTWNGFNNPPTNLAIASSQQVTNGRVTKITTGATRWQTIFSVAESGADFVGGNYNWLFTSGPSGNPFNNKWAGVSVNHNTLQTYTHNAGADNTINLSNGNWYTMNWRDIGYANTTAIFMVTSAEPVFIDNVTRTPTIVSPGQVPTLNLTLNTAKSAEERVYVIYTTDNFSTRTAVEVTNFGEGTTGSVTLPAANAETVYTYYSMTTTVDLLLTGQNGEYYDMRSIRINNNSGSNYSYTVASSWATVEGATTWTNAASWASGAVPVANQPVTIAHNITLDTDVTISSLTINSGATFTSNDDEKRVLSIARSASGSATTFVNNGTWDNGFGRSQVRFTGAPSSGDVIHQVGGSSFTAFDEVVIAKTGGSSNIGGSFGTGTSVTGLLRISTGGFIATAPPAGFYGEQATLEFNQGASATYEVNAGDFSWSTSQVPNNIKIMSGTVQLNAQRSFSGLLTINSGATLAAGGNLVAESGASIINNGTITGNATFQRTFAGHTRWVLISAPVVGPFSGAGGLLNSVTTQGFAGSDFPDAAPNVLRYNETAAGTDLQRFVAPSANEMAKGVGYAAYIYERKDRDDAGSTVNFATPFSISGTPHVLSGGTFDFGVTYTSGNGDGWNLIGNPTPAYLNWTTESGAWSLTNMSAYMYVWDPACGISGCYRATSTDGTYNVEDVSEGVLESTTNHIAPFQGFWVKATGVDPSLAVNAAAMSESTTPFLSKERILPRLAFEATSAEGYTSDATFFFAEGAQAGLDNNDAYQLTPLTGDYISLFSQVEGKSIRINNLPTEFESYEIPMGVQSVRGGNFVNDSMTLTWTFNDQLHDDWAVEMVDNVTGMVVNLRETNSYTFNVNEIRGKVSRDNTSSPVVQAVEDSRFVLKITNGATTSVEVGADLPVAAELSQNYPNPFNPTTRITYAVPVSGEVRLAVYDLLGREVATLVSGAVSAGSHTVNFDASALGSGVYVYRLSVGGQTITRKMTLVK